MKSESGFSFAIASQPFGRRNKTFCKQKGSVDISPSLHSLISVTRVICQSDVAIHPSTDNCKSRVPCSTCSQILMLILWVKVLV